MARQARTRARGADRAERSDKQRNRKRIVEAAASLIDERGVDVPLEEIARRAGVGSATMHRHFGNRADLFEAVFVGEAEEIAARARALTAGGDLARALGNWLRELYLNAASSRGLARSLAGTSEQVGRDGPSCLSIVLDGGAELLDRARAAGVVNDGVELQELVALVLGVVLVIDEGVGGDVNPQRLVELIIGLAVAPRPI
ncbi:TetR/AcrR family transcriptional regulator [Amycolatopsis sp. GM8]|uniref:TetR/AcrR family transcriptional regulator n=1 Tax=Amycolatopsis sp. GM8 TaxID=2896530 RepID=UPI001F35856B|nr:helix-turn-helix domain-containing protein [Amycolatopsis sp. GM8]